MRANGLLHTIAKRYPFRKGRQRVLSFCRKRLSGLSLTEDAFGNRYLLDLDNYVDSMIYLEGAYEKDNILLFMQQAQQQNCTVFIDIGANIGMYTLCFAGLGNIEQVHSFEPVSGHYAQLQANLWLNRQLNKVVTHKLALSDHHGEATFYVPRVKRLPGNYQYNTSTSSLNGPTAAENDAYSVPVRTLDEMLDYQGRSLAIKIDVEGHEENVIKGMEAILKTNNCLLLMEVWDKNLEAIDRRLQESGYHRQEGNLWGDNHLYAKK